MFLVMLLIASIPLAFLVAHRNSAALTSNVTDDVKVPELVIREYQFWPNETVIVKVSSFKANHIIPPNVTTCHGFGFSCTETPAHVIGTNSRCDGHVDCNDASDEFDCSRCQTSFSCLLNAGSKVKLCLRGEQLCDGIKSCIDGSDEAICGKECDNKDLKCKKGNTTICVSPMMICDGDKHCPNGDDEKNCLECKKGAKLCESTKQCIPAWEVCDGKQNCPDGSDETDCDCYGCSGIDKALCKGSKKVCIEKHQLCDGHQDCPGGEDEENCPGSCPLSVFHNAGHTDIHDSKTKTVFDSLVKCSDGKSYPWRHACSGHMVQCDESCRECNLELAFKCGTGIDNNTSQANFDGKASTKCIPRINVCDGRVDCNDGSDEIDCTCDRFKSLCSPHNKNPLLKQRCYSKEQQCDGYKDCPNGDDEKDCKKCSGESFKCVSNGQCIQGIHRCDGIDHCDDKSDEADCSCEECKRQPFPMYKCKDRCLRLEHVCTPKSNCPNATKLDRLYCAFRKNPKGFRLM